MKKSTKLTIETESVFLIRGTERRLMCEACQEVVNMLTVNEAARVARVSARAIYRLVEAGKFHFTENEESLLICFNSLFRSLLEAEENNLAPHPKLDQREERS